MLAMAGSQPLFLLAVLVRVVRVVVVVVLPLLMLLLKLLLITSTLVESVGQELPLAGISCER